MEAMRRHVLIGIGAAFLLIVVYLGLITLAQDLSHAIDQTGDLWYWVLALVGAVYFKYVVLRSGFYEKPI